MFYNPQYFAIFLSLIVKLIVNCQCSSKFHIPVVNGFKQNYPSALPLSSRMSMPSSYSPIRGVTFFESNTGNADDDDEEEEEEEKKQKTPREIIPCEIPNEDKPGICIEITKCTAYLQVRNSTNLPAERVNFLKKVQCVSNIAFDESSGPLEPLVCCTANGQDYRYPSLKFTKFEYRRFQDATARFKRKKLKRRIQSVEPMEGSFNLWNECGKQVTHRIYGGEIAELDEFPWLALLVYNTNEYGCSGALIDDQHVLTAAHCVYGEGYREKKGLKHIRLGEFNVKTEPDCIEERNYLSCADAAMDIAIQEIFVHPDYKDLAFNKYNDIAVIRLKQPVSFTHFVMPICLPNKTEDSPFEKGQMFSVSGWGRTDLFNKYFINIPSPIKLKLRIPLMSRENCTKVLEMYGIQLGPKQLCAGGEYAKDTCAGDSGGPLMFFDRKHSRWVTYGIVSYGFTQCGLAGHPAVYTNVADYNDWIRETIGQRHKRK